ncbi:MULTISPECIES: AraC family transcriptional regulator [Pseudomonas]|uniref:AraC family transcriptional regulator n=1 Tax=Pseudomonas TaxID=286 RepID=UPI000A6BFA06|nr:MULTISPECIES: AraC family transcriptional regulator [Pseudomonas]
MTIQSKKHATLTPVHLCACITSYLEQAGIPLDDVLFGTGLKPLDFEKSAKMVDLDQEQLLLSNALRLSGCPFLGLDIGLAARISSYGLLGYAMMTAADLRSGLQIPITLPALLGTYFSLSLVVDGEKVQLRADHCRAPKELEPILTELCLGSFKTIMSDMVGSSFELVQACFRYESFEGASEAYRDAFGCEVQFEYSCSMIVFDTAALDICLPLANSLCHRKTLELCQHQNRDLVSNREWLEKLRTFLALNLKEPPAFDALAQQMHCSSRTLRRQLDGQHTSYRQQLDELRFAKAKALLSSESGTIDQIAEQVGFSDGAALRRAFRRWCGLSPKVFRS